MRWCGGHREVNTQQRTAREKEKGEGALAMIPRRRMTQALAVAAASAAANGGRRGALLTLRWPQQQRQQLQTAATAAVAAKAVAEEAQLSRRKRGGRAENSERRGTAVLSAGAGEEGPADGSELLHQLEDEYSTLKVNWFPGHMVKATKVIREKLKQVN